MEIRVFLTHDKEIARNDLYPEAMTRRRSARSSGWTFRDTGPLVSARQWHGGSALAQVAKGSRKAAELTSCDGMSAPSLSRPVREIKDKVDRTLEE